MLIRLPPIDPACLGIRTGTLAVLASTRPCATTLDALLRLGDKEWLIKLDGWPTHYALAIKFRGSLPHVCETLQSCGRLVNA